MGEFFKNRITGTKSEDFTEASLPSTRRKLFFKLVRTQIIKLEKVNAWTFLFFLPLIVWNTLADAYSAGFDANSVQAYTQFVLTCKFPVGIVLSIVAFLSLAGTFYTVRSLAWGMPVKVTRYFFKGIKDSWKPFAFIGFMCGIFSSLFELALYFLQLSSFGFAVDMFMYAFLAFAALLLLSILMLFSTMSSLYKMSFAAALKNSVLLTVKFFIKNIGTVLYTVLPFWIWCAAGIIYLNFITYLLLAFIGFWFISLCWVLHTNSIYDAVINLRQYPDFYRKGLSPNDDCKKAATQQSEGGEDA